MDIGVVIKKYRKEAGMTQEEMANRLGVTTPAVNKWENSNSKPDIELLAPIARLLDISLDTLLSFHEKLSDTEIEEIIRKMDRMFSEEGYEKTYEWALRLIKEYPNCNMLIWQAAVMLDARRITDKCTNPEKYDKQINAWYELALHDENEEIQHHAADSLFGFYLRKKDYTKAEKYLDYFSEYDPMKSYYQGRLLQKQGKIKEAYEKYENIIFSGFSTLNFVLSTMAGLALRENDIGYARFLSGKVQAVGLVGLHDAGDGTVLPPPAADAAQYRPGKAAHPGLQKQVGRRLLPRLSQLIKDLPGQGGIPLHDPDWDLLIARPGGVLDQHPAVFFALAGGQAHRVVVVEVGDLCLCPQGQNIVQPFLGAPLGEIDHRPAAQFPGRPGHAPAVVSVRGSDEGDLSQLLPGFGLGEGGERELVPLQSQLLSHPPGNGPAASQSLKSIESKPLGLVLHPQFSYSQFPGQGGQRDQRGGLIAGDGAVKVHGPLHRLGIRMRQGGGLGLGLMIDIIVHRRSSTARPGISGGRF